MKNKAIILISILVVLIGLGAGYWYLKIPKNSALATISESDAVEAIKNRYPELKDYPNEKLPTKPKPATAGISRSSRKDPAGR